MNGQRHTVSDETRALVKRLYGTGNTTYRKLAGSLGLPESMAGSLADIVSGRPSVGLATENTIRRRLGLPCIGTVEAPVCRTCGGDHRLEDCGGKPVRTVVALARGEYVVRRHKAPDKWRDMATADVALAFRGRLPYNPTVARTDR